MTTGERIACSAFGQFMASMAGRGIRIVLGLGLITGGVALDSTGGWVLAVFGLLPLASGVFGLCPVTGLIGGLWTDASVKACAARR